MTPPDGAGLSFATHIQPLFRERDRTAMLFTFDLWDAADVQENADAILEVVREGRMPCDNAWSDEQVALLQQWVDAGFPE